MGSLGWMATGSATATQADQADQVQSTLATPVSADLAIVSNTASVRHAKVGQEVTFTVVATNNGPDPAALDVNTNQASTGLRIVKITCDRGISPDTPFCEYGKPLLSNETVTTRIVAEVQAGSNYARDTSCVTSGEQIDPNPSNDCATATLRIIGKR
jgi:uncharacterized repeat protein (TIGR01451 family)